MGQELRISLRHCKIQVLTHKKTICIIRSTQEEMIKMVTLNTRDELVSFLYDSDPVYTLVGIANIGGELLDEALRNPSRDGTQFYINYFFPMGDEDEEIVVDENGNVLSDSIYY